MRFAFVAFLLGSLGVASAHFSLQYPPPRGVFVEDDEPTFCGTFSWPTMQTTDSDPVTHRWLHELQQQQDSFPSY